MPMQKVLVMSRGGEQDCEKKVFQEFKVELKKAGFEIVKENPDFVVTLGGDGTFLFAERLYPGIPKLILRDSRICRLCSGDCNIDSIEKLKKEEFTIKEFAKIELKFRRKIYLASNDIVIRNVDQRMALRFKADFLQRCPTSGHPLTSDIKIRKDISAIGDGVVFATSQGSTGYFHSITRKSFEKGFGLAFNNTTETILPIISDSGFFEFTITRGKAKISCDNSPELLTVRTGEKIMVALSQKKAKVIVLK